MYLGIKDNESMKIFNELLLKFEKSDWSANPEFCVIDIILESRPDIILMLKSDIIGNERASTFGRQDTPSVEQIVRAAIFKEMRGMDYRELEYSQNDSRICGTFIKLEGRDPYSFQMFQKYISRIKPESLHRVLVEINKIAISEGLEDVKSVSQDSTVVKTNIHYPTNNSLVWDCVKTSTRLLAQLKEEIDTLDFIDSTKSAKETFYEINITRGEAKRIPLFQKQLILFTKVINQTRVLSPWLAKKRFTLSFHNGYTGYLVKKMMDDTKTTNDYNTNIWIVFRYAEIVLNYAEACMELGDNTTAATYINMIRKRSGLPDFTGDIETALRHERKIEFTFEDLRWYDIRRWKTLETVLTNAKGMDIVETKNMDDGTVTTTWQLINCQNRSVSKKMYWIPIPNTEIKKAPQLVQNPGY